MFHLLSSYWLFFRLVFASVYYVATRQPCAPLNPPGFLHTLTLSFTLRSFFSLSFRFPFLSPFPLSLSQ